MANIETLVDDIYNLFSNPDLVVSDAEAEAFGSQMAQMIKTRLVGENKKPTLRMSNIGEDCTRKLWYMLNQPENNEKLPPEARIKFLFGDILEILLLFLAKKAGHTVEGEQDEVTLHGVVGHRDAVIDGVLVDVKSASTYSFRKFQEGLTPQNDPFGYITQLGLYLEAGQEDPIIKEKNKAYWLVIDKTLGKITLSKMDRSKSTDWKFLVEQRTKEANQSTLPLRAYPQEPEGKSGNMALGVKCSYCPAKFQCWPNVRTFLYSTGPKFLTKVVNEPKVPEVT